jgi:hypothetical protein
MSRSVKAGIGVVLALVLAFGLWTVMHRGSDAVFQSVVAPVDTTIVAPQYAAQMERRLDANPTGLIVRAGTYTQRVPTALAGVWLDDGRYLVSQVRNVRCPSDDEGTAYCSDWDGAVLDPRTGRMAAIPGVTDPKSLELPGEAVHRVNLAVGEATSDAPAEALLAFPADLTAPQRLRLPGYDGNNRSMRRDTQRRVFSIGDWDYVRYSDNDGEDATESYGYLRRSVGSGRWQKVLVDQRLVAIWVSRDGRALLGLQQKRGEPCGGCATAQQIVEIDPEKGEIVGSYGVPDDYDKSWRVAEIDKVDDRVVVRYVHRRNIPQNLGVWQYDGSWELVPGTDGPFTWWQGPDDRIEARPMDVEPVIEDLVPFELFWVHGKTRTRLAGQVAPDAIASWQGIPGSLVAPE